ncbi:hypothetical protein PCANB_001098 [Pneumocystis canis]|nr:hypothetical protein PCANB_001098 [Pneumocystis canis]
MADMAKISLIGRVGNEMVVETGQSGRDYIRYSLACQNGPDRTSWFRIINFDTRSNEYMLSSVKKGSLVYVDGVVQLGSYSTDDGKRHTSISVIQRNIQLLKGPRDANDETEKQETT